MIKSRMRWAVIKDTGGTGTRKEKPLGRPRRRWEDNIKMDFKRESIGWYGLD
jgi:hypothetical protein